MKTLLCRYFSGISRFAAVFTTIVAGMAFVVVTGAIAAPGKAKVEAIKKPEKIEAVVKAEKVDSKANNIRNFNNRVNFNRNINPFFFNRFNRAFNVDELID